MTLKQQLRHHRLSAPRWRYGAKDSNTWSFFVVVRHDAFLSLKVLNHFVGSLLSSQRRARASRATSMMKRELPKR